MSADARRTSYFYLTSGDEEEGVSIDRVEIPLFQRDYAQGRPTDGVRRIRTDFLEVLATALADGDATPVGLDFVYGGVDEGTLRPLDGQQRLTTLFLLHWYTASRAGHLAQPGGWKHFSYATRQSARMFCESLVEHALPEGDVLPSEWITDQPWYLFLWRHDPTIQSMLVMLDAIRERFHDLDPAGVWSRLTHPEEPAIWFLLLPLSGLGPETGEDVSPENLYIRMNSRGKPLTEFENFKAHFEKTIQWSPRADEFALKVDTDWSDLLWGLRGDDDLIDDEFLRYLEFITEICEWRDGRADGQGQQIGPRTRAVFGIDNPQREAHLELLFQALDVWMGLEIPEVFSGLFLTGADPEGSGERVRLFFRQDGGELDPLNLFEICCRSYGQTRARARAFSLGQTLTLYAVLLHLVEATDDFPRRLRVLRNVIEASSDELRPDRMPKILEDVHQVIRHGDVAAVTTLNQAQVDDEQAKAAFLADHPDLQSTLFALEDHELLHGSLVSFELGPATLATHADQFQLLMAQPAHWPDLLAALISVGEYQRQRTGSRPFLFGTSSKRHDNAWRELLTGAPRGSLQRTRATLGELLDRVAAADTALAETLKAITNEYLATCEAEHRYDWRYYMAKYPAMRGEGSSTYFAEREQGSEQASMGYSLCMLRAGGRALNGYYRDPYLYAIQEELKDAEAVEDGWFTGYESEPRRLRLTKSGASIRCVPQGFELSPPPGGESVEEFATALGALGVETDHLVAVPQAEIDGRLVDSADRIRLGTEVVHALAKAGL